MSRRSEEIKSVFGGMEDCKIGMLCFIPKPQSGLVHYISCVG